MLNHGGMDTLAGDRQTLPERRSQSRRSVLSELGELIMVTLDSQRGLLLTLCAGGISVQAQNRLTPGDKLTAQFHLPPGEPAMSPTCEVVWANDNCEAGLKFFPLADSKKRALEDWLISHEAGSGSVLADAATVGTASAAMDGNAPEPPTYEELAAALEKLMSPAPPASGSTYREPPAAEAETLEQLLPRIVARANSLTQAEGAALVLHGEGGLVCRASIGNAPPVGSRLRPGSGLSGECIRLGQVVRCDDVEKDPRVNSAVAHRLQSRSILIVPIRTESLTLGLLQVLAAAPAAFSAAHAATLEHLAGIVASFLAAEERKRQAPFAKPPLGAPIGLADSSMASAAGTSRAHDSLLYPDLS